MGRPGRDRWLLSRGGIAILAIGWTQVGHEARDRLPAEPQAQTLEGLAAAVVLTFARFVEWSPKEFPSATAPIVVGIVADESVALALEAVSRGRTVAGRPMAVTRLQWDSDFAGLHVLFVGEAERRHLEIVLARVRARPILTVSSLPSFGRAGGMITLTFTDGRVSFRVNSHATGLSGMQLSSFLLSHATRVGDESSGGSR